MSPVEVHRIVGIDPGSDGAIAYIELSGSNVEVIKTIRFKDSPLLNVTALRRECQMFNSKNTHFYIEKVHSMPHQGLASTFKFGVAVGLLHMFVRGVLGREFVLVDPLAWQRPFKHVVPRRKNVKHRTKEMFEFWVGGSERLHDGEIDAVLIGLGGFLRENDRQLYKNGERTLRFPKGAKNGVE